MTILNLDPGARQRRNKKSSMSCGSGSGIDPVSKTCGSRNKGK
jgi:hypothetical protein